MTYGKEHDARTKDPNISLVGFSRRYEHPQAVFEMTTKLVTRNAREG